MNRIRCWFRGHVWSIWRTALIGCDLIAERSCERCCKQQIKDAFQ